MIFSRKKGLICKRQRNRKSESILYFDRNDVFLFTKNEVSLQDSAQKVPDNPKLDIDKKIKKTHQKSYERDVF